MYSHETYLSPLTWRYGSEEMRQTWSEVNKRRLWRRLWVALAESQAEFGLVSRAQIDDLRAHVDDVDIERAETNRGAHWPRSHGGSEDLRRAMPGGWGDHTPGRHVDGYRRQCRCAAPAGRPWT